MIVSCILVMLVGCASKPPATSPSVSSSSRLPHPTPHEPFANPPATAPVGTAAVQIDIYQLSVPYGTVSRNEKFWKRIDEQCIDVATADVLYRNGIRAGQAATSEWDYFRNIMEQNPALASSRTLLSPEGNSIELPLGKEMLQQDIFYYDAAGHLHGRSFDHSQNLMTLSFQPAPRKPQAVRLALCPLVRCTRRRLEYTAMNREDEIAYTAPEHLYELNLRTDVPMNNFLVVAPSAESTWATSLGNRFLIAEGPAERIEIVLLFVPRIVHASQPRPIASSPQ
jgi:hypothetical protein